VARRPEMPGLKGLSGRPGGAARPLPAKLGVSGLIMCTPVKFSKLIRLVNIANSDPRSDKYSKLIEIVTPLCHEKIENKIRVKTLNDLLKKQKLRSTAFVMYVDLRVENNFIVLEYPFYPKKY
jgi:hypothetical protein